VALVVDRVTVGYGDTVVLRDVSMSVAPGRLLAVTGPSGAGKTTLLWTMAGLIRPSRGSVTVHRVAPRGPEHVAAEQVAVVPQEIGLAPTLTAAENVQVALLAAGVKPADARRRCAEALARVGLADQADQLVEELSGGQRQRVAVARGVAARARVLLADEVTSELDARARALVLDVLRAEAGRGAVVVFATHDPEAAAGCDARVRLVEGRAEPA
jgi:putative ABC transport system ATP-binding protein